jgi:HrpA-like RNA helicase
MVGSLLQKYPHLRIVVMSATIDMQFFAKYFTKITQKVPAMVKIPGRCFPVEKYFLNDCQSLLNANGFKVQKDDKDYVNTMADIVQYITEKEPPGAILCFLPGILKIKELAHLILSRLDSTNFDLHILHSAISSDKQAKVFEPVKPGTRKIILSTNIAETSVTINDIVYVVDSAREHVETFNELTNLKGVSEIFCTQDRLGQVIFKVCSLDREWVVLAAFNLENILRSFQKLDLMVYNPPGHQKFRILI